MWSPLPRLTPFNSFTTIQPQAKCIPPLSLSGVAGARAERMAAMNIHHLQLCHHPFSLLFLIAASNLLVPAAAGRPIAELNPASLYPLSLLRLFWHIRMGSPVSSSLCTSTIVCASSLVEVDMEGRDRKGKGVVKCSHGKEGEKDESLQIWIGKEEEKKQAEEEEEEEEGRRWLINEKRQQLWGSNGQSNPDVINFKETNNNFNNNGSVSFRSEEEEGEKLPETNSAMKDHTTYTSSADAGQSTAPNSNASTLNEDASPTSTASPSDASKPKDAGTSADSQSTTTPIATDGSTTASPPPNASNPSKSPDPTDLKTSSSPPSASDSGSQPGNPSKAGDGFSNPLSLTSTSNSKDDGSAPAPTGKLHP